jgi:dehydrogenase/reductase SDR family protein 7
MDINVLGQVSLTKLVCQHFKEQKKGQIAVSVSVCGKFACPFSASYNASKFALMGYFDTVRNELPFVDVTLMCPGPIFTQIIAKAHMAGDFQSAKRSYDKNDKRMAVERAAFLYCLAVANKLDEAWISLKPILFLFYGIQYFPSTFRRFEHIFLSPSRLICMHVTSSLSSSYFLKHRFYRALFSPEKVIAMREGRL